MKDKILFRLIWNRFRKDKLSMLSFLFILMLLIISIFPYKFMVDKTKYASKMNLEISTIDPMNKLTILNINNEEIIVSDYINTSNGIKYIRCGESDYVNYQGFYEIKERMFFFGTDRYGRDYYSRLIYGTRISISIGFISVLISLIIGVFLGSISGYFGGFVDDAVMFLINIVWSIPTLLMVIAITLALGKGYWQVFLAVGLTMWVEIARVVRGEFISQKRRQYVEAARVLGFTNFRIIFKHILPNVLSSIIVISAANFAAAILIEAGLSFLGLGVQPPAPSWGAMIKDHYNYILMDKSYLSIIPGLSIMLTVLAFILFGNGLRDSFDVKE